MRLFIGFFLLLCLPQECFSQPLPNDKQAQSWRQTLEDIGFEGVVSIRQDEHQLFYYDSSPDAGDLFWIGSVSKQFAAASILALVDQGKIDLEATVHRYLPLPESALRRNGKTCTIEQLLTNTCGLPAGSRVCPSLDLHRQRDAFLACVSELELDFEPGSDFQYSNTGFALVGLLVEIVSDGIYETFLRREFAEPLGMQYLGVALKHRNDLRKRLREGQLHVADVSFSPQRWLALDPYGQGRSAASGNVFANEDSLHNWNQGLHGGKVLSPKSYAKLTKPVKKNYAMGILSETKDGVFRYWHNGGLIPMSHSSHMAYVPEHRLSVVVLSNRSPMTSNVDSVAESLIAAFAVDAHFSPQQVSVEADALDLAFIIIALLILVSTFTLLFHTIRGPRSSALSWSIIVILFASLSAICVQIIDFFEDHSLIKWALAVIVLLSSVAHRKGWARAAESDLVNSKSKTRLFALLVMTFALLYATAGQTRAFVAMIVFMTFSSALITNAGRNTLRSAFKSVQK